MSKQHPSVNTCASYLLVAVDEKRPQCGWLEPPVWSHCHIVPLTDVLNVHRNTGILGQVWSGE